MSLGKPKKVCLNNLYAFFNDKNQLCSVPGVDVIYQFTPNDLKIIVQLHLTLLRSMLNNSSKNFKSLILTDVEYSEIIHKIMKDFVIHVSDWQHENKNSNENPLEREYMKKSLKIIQTTMLLFKDKQDLYNTRIDSVFKELALRKTWYLSMPALNKIIDKINDILNRDIINYGDLLNLTTRVLVLIRKPYIGFALVVLISTFIPMQVLSLKPSTVRVPKKLPAIQIYTFYSNILYVAIKRVLLEKYDIFMVSYLDEIISVKKSYEKIDNSNFDSKFYTILKQIKYTNGEYLNKALPWTGMRDFSKYCTREYVFDTNPSISACTKLYSHYQTSMTGDENSLGQYLIKLEKKFLSDKAAETYLNEYLIPYALLLNYSTKQLNAAFYGMLAVLFAKKMNLEKIDRSTKEKHKFDHMTFYNLFLQIFELTLNTKIFDQTFTLKLIELKNQHKHIVDAFATAAFNNASGVEKIIGEAYN